jgi:LPS export ABC transporter protein LptC
LSWTLRFEVALRIGQRWRPSALAALGLLPVLAGCQERLATEEPAVPFVFRSLNLRQQDSQGRPAWQLNSPEARYDLSRKLAQARALQGTIFSAGQPLYRVSASSGTVLNDGALIQLEGQVTMVRLGPQPLVVKAQRVRWYPPQQRMVLDLRPVAVDRDLEVSADRAVLLLDQDRLELRGAPTFSRRAARGAAPPQVVLTVSSADWSPGSGALTAPGPVRAVRNLSDGKPPQTLTSPYLRGNTIERIMVLQGPVRFSDPSARAQLLGGEATIELGRDAVVSRQPFSGSIGELKLAGQGFELLNRQTLAVISPGCRLRQPEETIEAQRCQWNWSDQTIEARHGVILRRQANDQVTRASHLDGRVGPDGLAVFSSPGSRVNTRLRLPPSQQGSSTEPPARRSAIGL